MKERKCVYVGVFFFLSYIWNCVLGFFIFYFWVCVLGSEFVFLLFLFKTHLDLNSSDF